MNDYYWLIFYGVSSLIGIIVAIRGMMLTIRKDKESFSNYFFLLLASPTPIIMLFMGLFLMFGLIGLIFEFPEWIYDKINKSKNE